MDEDDMQQFSLRWHNHQSSVIGALGRMLTTGALADVTLSASGATLRAHRLVLASCSQYFAQLFKELESESGSVVVVLACGAVELRLLLTFMYTGEVTAPRGSLPALLQLAQTLKVSGLTAPDTNSTLTPAESDEKPELIENAQSNSPVNLDIKNDNETSNSTIDTIVRSNPTIDHDKINFDALIHGDEMPSFNIGSNMTDVMLRNEKDRLSKLDQIVQNLYSTHKIESPHTVPGTTAASVTDASFSSKYRAQGSICTICNKRLSNQYNLRVHMETHAGTRHRCHACTHISRSRDALRKHVAYRHPHSGTH